MGFECGFSRLVFRKEGDTVTEAAAALDYADYLEHLKVNGITKDDESFKEYSGLYDEEDLPEDITPYLSYLHTMDIPYYWCSIGHVLDDIAEKTLHLDKCTQSVYMTSANLRTLRQAVVDKILNNLPTPIHIRSAVYYKYDEETDTEDVLMKHLDGVGVTVLGDNDNEYSQLIDCRGEDAYAYHTTYALLDSEVDGEQFDALVSFVRAIDDILNRAEKNEEDFFYYRSW